MPDTNSHELLMSRQTIVSRDPWVPVVLAGYLIFFALILCLFGGSPKITPGGPFISVFGDIIPFALTIAAMIYGLVGLRSSNTLVEIGAVTAILFATLVMGLHMFLFFHYWFDPYSRGGLIGW